MKIFSSAKVSPLSVNSVILDEYCGTSKPLPLMTACHLRFSGSSISCNETTVIYGHENLAAHLILAFAPQFKLFYDEEDQCNEFATGVLGGIGYELPTDISIKLNTPLHKSEINLCEGIRYFLSFILAPNSDSIGSRKIASDVKSIESKRLKLIEFTLKLLTLSDCSKSSEKNDLQASHIGEADDGKNDQDYSLRMQLQQGNYKWN